MVQFLSVNFFSWISSIFVGFFKSSHFFVSSVFDKKLGGFHIQSGTHSFCSLSYDRSKANSPKSVT